MRIAQSIRWRLRISADLIGVGIEILKSWYSFSLERPYVFLVDSKNYSGGKSGRAEESSYCKFLLSDMPINQASSS